MRGGAVPGPLARDCGVGHERRMADQALDPAEALRELPDRRAPDGVHGFLLAPHQEGHHRAEVAHLPLGQVVRRVVAQAGEVDAGDLGMAGQELGDENPFGGRDVCKLWMRGAFHRDDE